MVATLFENLAVVIPAYLSLRYVSPEIQTLEEIVGIPITRFIVKRHGDKILVRGTVGQTPGSAEIEFERDKWEREVRTVRPHCHSDEDARQRVFLEVWRQGQR